MSCFGFAGLAAIRPGASLAFVMLAMGVVGLGTGVCLPNIMVSVQNAAERRDVGTATGALLFLRSLGGAFGSTMVGAVLTGVFASRLAAGGYPAATADLGALKPGGALAVLGPAAETAGRLALSTGFSLAFLAVLGFFVIAVVIALGLRDLPLRTVSGSAPEPAALGH